MKTILLSAALILLSACSNEDDAVDFYESVQLGKKIFDENCAQCHGSNGQGTVEDWTKKLPDGKYPPPPLNGTAHAWHHSPQDLLQSINEGSIKLGGVMPGFKDKLNNQEKRALVDYIYSLWSPEIQRAYNKRFK